MDAAFPYFYQVREDLVIDEDSCFHTVYGIEVVELPSGQILDSYTLTDLFTDRQRAEELAALCTQLELDPCQLIDVAEDALV